MVAAAADTTDGRAWDFAQLGVLVVTQLVTPAALDEVGLIAAVDVLDMSTVHANPFPRGLTGQGTIFVNERKDDCSCSTADALRVNLEVRGNRHEGAGEQWVGPQFRGQILSDHPCLVHHGDATQLGPGESLDRTEFNKLPKQGSDDMAVREYQRSTEVTSEGQYEVALGDRPTAAENLRRAGNHHGEASLKVSDQVDRMSFLECHLQLVNISAAEPYDHDLGGVWGHGSCRATLSGPSGGGAALHRLSVTCQVLGSLLVNHGSLSEVLWLPHSTCE
jgi:hypothetical protein